MLLSALAAQIGGRLQGGDAEFSSISTDTRAIAPGDFFVALEGARFDAHDYVEQAIAAGAIGVMVAKECNVSAPQLMVEDTRLGLGNLAKAWLAQFDLKKVAITGSSGKTTVKEMVAAILSEQGPTLATLGNLNNDIGVPLTLCRVQAKHEFVVVEMGANHVGEIAYTVALVQPDVALVNNVAAAHLEGFGSIARVAEAKSEIYLGLECDGVAIINLDDDYAALFMERTGHCKRLTYSMHDSEADIHVLSATANDVGQYRAEILLQGKPMSVSVPLIGLHNVENALAAIAIASVLGCNGGVITAGMESVKAVPGRLCVVEDITTHRVIDDTYNANPGSMRSAIDVLSEAAEQTCLVLGGMGELGAESNSLHREIGVYAAQKGIKTVYGLGEQAAHYREGYLSHLPAGGAFVVAQNHQLLADDILENQVGKTILIKGSRSALMETVIHRMIDRQRNERSTR
jgi:UDP-N-acetylmuramoyl-tripeptide--D-alanyl-D-alanine ligase